ncbi:ABC transporter permease [Haloarcula nitratireducens]|uniref:ABC transporter permease n=1 Tax=Haloarcula nitratireducens TaxID=2487749 RepID=UPI001C72B89B|nr:ABC transporter permease [Halomicroarcula nitratireducens]
MGATEQTSAPTVLETLRERVYRPELLVAPLVVFELAFFVVPLIMLVRVSLLEQTTSGAYVAGTLTLANYQEVLFSSHFQDILFFSFKFAILVTTIATVLSVFFAYAIWRADGILKNALLFIVVVTLLTTLVVRLFSILIILSPNGPLNQLLVAIKVLRQPVLLVTNLFGATVGQVYTIFPYTVLSIYSVLSILDWAKVEAARDLGATELVSFREIVLPQITSGILVGAVISFAWSFGAYAAPFLLGSTRQDTAAMEVYRLMVTRFNWPLATALSFVVLLVVLASVSLLFFVSDDNLGDAYGT